MPSLAAHLCEPEVHDRLPFHPSCPICRQTRMMGRLPADDLLSVRTQALLATGVLAASSTAPAARAFAGEPDQQRDGTATVIQSATDSADSPDFDPGGDATDLPQTAPALPQTQAPADPGNDDTAPLDQTATTDPVDPVVDPGDGSDANSSTPTPPPAPPQAPVPIDASTGTTTTEP